MGTHGAGDRDRRVSDDAGAGRPAGSTTDRRVSSRRRVLLATAGIAATGPLAGCLDGGTDETDGDDPDTESDASPPFEVRTVDAPGSEGGTMSVPSDEGLVAVNFSRTNCPTSAGVLPYIGEARSDLTDTDVTFLTVVDGSSGPQPSPEELTDWWVEHDGDWPVGVDEDGRLFDYYDVRGVPVVAVIDAAGAVRWRDEGGTTTANIVSGIERALEDDSSGGEADDGTDTGTDTDD